MTVKNALSRKLKLKTWQQPNSQFSLENLELHLYTKSKWLLAYKSSGQMKKYTIKYEWDETRSLFFIDLQLTKSWHLRLCCQIKETTENYITLNYFHWCVDEYVLLVYRKFREPIFGK